MATKGNINILINAIKQIRNENKVMDGSEGNTDTDAINNEANILANAISDYIQTITFAATPANVSAAGFVSPAGSVTSSSNLIVKPIS
jgi:hypothetical protein